MPAHRDVRDDPTAFMDTVPIELVAWVVTLAVVLVNGRLLS